MYTLMWLNREDQTVLSSATRIHRAAIDCDTESDIYTVEGHMFHQATMKY